VHRVRDQESKQLNTIYLLNLEQLSLSTYLYLPINLLVVGVFVACIVLARYANPRAFRRSSRFLRRSSASASR
jgi:hypothetical protein